MRFLTNTSTDLSFSIENDEEHPQQSRPNAALELWSWLNQAPSFIKTGFLITALLVTLEGAHFSSTGQLLHRQIVAGPLYGPPSPSSDWHAPESYSFSQVGPAFNRSIKLWRLDELNAQQIKSIMLKSTPRRLKKGLSTYVDVALRYSQAFQVDPFWVLSIMCVESHFEPSAMSQVMAQGLMQIMPATSHYLNKLMDRDMEPRLARELTKDPHHNVELGVFYLRRLLSRFQSNYIHATVAYNMGPGYTRRRLRWGLPVGTKNIYLDKVNRAYSRLSRGIITYFAQNAAAYVDTYVVSRRWQHEWQEIQLFTWWDQEVGGETLTPLPPLMSHLPMKLGKNTL